MLSASHPGQNKVCASFTDFNVKLLSQVTNHYPSSIRWANLTIKTKMVKLDMAENELVFSVN